MSTIVKHHFSMIDLTSYIMIPLLIIMGYIFRISPMFLFSITLVSVPIIIYYLNNKNNVDRFLVSLPLSKLSILRSRYIFSLLIAIIVLVLQSLLMVTTYVFLGDILYVYDWRDILILVSISLIVPAIAIPIYQSVRSFPWATTIIGAIYIGGILLTLPLLINALNMGSFIDFNDLDAGLSPVIETYIPVQPYPVLFIGSIILFLGSMLLSHRLYTSTDH